MGKLPLEGLLEIEREAHFLNAYRQKRKLRSASL